MGRPYLHIGRHKIMLDDPQPDQIDLDEIDNRLRVMHRWSNNPAALTVHQHRRLVWALAVWGGASERTRQFCWHHDDHEAIIGDIPGPVLYLIGQHTPRLKQLANDLDRAIYLARGLPVPTGADYREVHVYDMASQTIEWLHVMGEEPQDWTPDVPQLMDTSVEELLDFTRSEVSVDTALVQWTRPDCCGPP